MISSFFYFREKDPALCCAPFQCDICRCCSHFLFRVNIKILMIYVILHFAPKLVLIAFSEEFKKISLRR